MTFICNASEWSDYTNVKGVYIIESMWTFDGELALNDYRTTSCLYQNLDKALTCYWS